MTRFLIFCIGVSFNQFLTPKEGSIKQCGVEGSERAVVFLQRVGNSLENNLVDVSAGNELGFEL